VSFGTPKTPLNQIRDLPRLQCNSLNLLLTLHDRRQDARDLGSEKEREGGRMGGREGRLSTGRPLDHILDPLVFSIDSFDLLQALHDGRQDARGLGREGGREA